MVTTDLTIQFIIRLAVAGLLGALIGLDREYRAKEAGTRTHFLVSLGSALIIIVSQWGFGDVVGHPGIGLDPSRVAAQVVSGIGFIGAGTIMMQKQFVRGLTTAAGLWATPESAGHRRRTLYGRHRGNPADSDRTRSAPLPAAELPEQMLDRQIRDS